MYLMRNRPYLFLLLLSLGGLTVQADFSYQETTRIIGGSMTRMMRFIPGGGKALEPRTSAVYVKGNRMATVGPETASIIDIDKETITEVNFEKKTYSVVTFQEMRDIMAQMQQALSQAGNQQQQPQMNMKVDVKFTGLTKHISGLNTREYLMTILMEAPQQQSGQPGMPGALTSLESNLWMAQEVPGYNQMIEFHKRMAEKAFTPEMLNSMASQIRGSSAAFKAMADKLSTLSGTPVFTVTRMKGVGMMGGPGGPGGPPSGGGQESAGNQDGQAPRIGGMAGAALGGLMRRRAQQKEQPAETASQPASAPASGSGDGVLMETSSEKSAFSTDSVDSSKLDVPAGFKQVESELKKSAERMRGRK